MSLINQMLRDLDQRRGPAAGADVAALHSLGLLGTGGTTRHLGRPGRLVWGVAGIAAVALCWLAGNVTGASNDQTAATLTTQRLPLPPPTPTLNPAGPARGGLRPAKSATEPPSQRSRQAEPQPIAAVNPSLFRRQRTPQQQRRKRRQRKSRRWRPGRRRTSCSTRHKPRLRDTTTTLLHIFCNRCSQKTRGTRPLVSSWSR